MMTPSLLHFLQEVPTGLIIPMILSKAMKTKNQSSCRFLFKKVGRYIKRDQERITVQRYSHQPPSDETSQSTEKILKGI